MASFKVQLPEQHLIANNIHIDMGKLREGNYLTRCFAMLVPYVEDEPFGLCMDMIDHFNAEVEGHEKLIAPATSYVKIMQNGQAEKISVILTIGDVSVIVNNFERLRYFYCRGVSMICLI
ncbi:MAG: membrane dipeptidase [Eggerthellaceae bacterium]|nr:membrane dipeptidase [Eggerthellaceae bacterium]